MNEDKLNDYRAFLLDHQEETKFYSIKSEKPETLKAERAIVHYISTPDLDMGRDVVDPKGMKFSYFDKGKAVWYNHEYKWNDHALPIARNLWHKKQNDGVLVKTQFATTEFADDVYMLHEGDFISTWSVGIMPELDSKGNIKTDSIEHDEGKNITTWHTSELLEYSSAPMAMNPNARDMIKSLKKINFKSPVTKNLVAMTELEFKTNEQILEIKEELSEIAEIQILLNSLIEKTEDNEKSILELTELLKNKNNNLEFKLPVNEFSGDRIKRAVRSIMEEKIKGE